MQVHYTKSGNVKHADNCKRVFKKYDMECPRCQELAAGAKPREWAKPSSYYTIRYNGCSHGAYDLNPSGSCNICGRGRDFS